MPAVTVKLLFVGGFLGAGKTTLLGRAARQLVEAGHRVGLITNDQAPDLVDTARLMGDGFTVGEVAGSCFCCDFPSLTRVCDQLIGKVQPDIILAEPVGSCTDISATVLQPIRKLLGEKFHLAPFTVLTDPLRLRDALIGPVAGGFPESVSYIFKTQLAEADLVVVNKTDTVPPADLQLIEDLFASAFPGKRLLRMSARTGEGVAAWLDLVLGNKPSGQSLAQVDYDLYAAGEAALGWLNMAGDLETSQPTHWSDFCVDCVSRIQSALRQIPAEVAHLKVRVESRDGPVQVNLTSTTSQPIIDDQRLTSAARPIAQLIDDRQKQGFSAEPTIDRAVLLLNARVHIEPDLLRQIVLHAVHAAGGETIDVSVTRLQSFKPSRPSPTHRMSAPS